MKKFIYGFIAGYIAAIVTDAGSPVKKDDGAL